MAPSREPRRTVARGQSARSLALYGGSQSLRKLLPIPDARRRPHTLDSIGLWPSGCPSSPFEETAGHELGVRLEAALAELPLQYREALLLVAIEGLTPSQAAQVCGVSGEAMRQRLSRGRAMLAERLRRTEQPLTVLKEVRP